ncbi:hypothetical protein AS189_12000 [Arthrobacter alpinus]|uniref:Uncharacterized protein n=2 Tax=Arthrobacter alpinus TaxID=656366 RepID=A0A0S2M007_9MICC|nr:hypothetical protein AS189_12000 [Arthrobacter alpinus]
MLASIPETSWQDGTMTSADQTTLMLPEVLADATVLTTRKAAPTELCKLPAVVLVEGLATPKEEAAP